MAHLVLVITLGVLLFFLMLIIGVALQWVSSRGQFMFLDCVKRNTAEVAGPWRQCRRLGNNLFVFRFLFGLTVLGALLGILAVGFLIAYADMAARRFDTAAIAGIVVAGVLLVVLVVGCGLLNQVITDFVMPIMYCRDIGVVAALRIFWEQLLPGNVAGFACFYLLRAALALGAGVFCCVAVCLTCCLAAIPYLSAVVFLPVSVFFRSYSLCFLAQFGPEWQLLPADVTPASVPPPPIPSAPLAGI